MKISYLINYFMGCYMYFLVLKMCKVGSYKKCIIETVIMRTQIGPHPMFWAEKWLFEPKFALVFVPINLNMMRFGCSKKRSHGNGSFEYPQHMFWLRNRYFNNIKIQYPLTREPGSVIIWMQLSTPAVSASINWLWPAVQAVKTGFN